MTRNEYQALVQQGLSIKKIAQTVGQTVYRTTKELRAFGLESIQPWNRYNPKVFECKTCGEKNPAKFYVKGNGRKEKGCCGTCRNAAILRQCNKNKARAVLLKGGKCERCGYDRCLGSLHFHHPEGWEKTYQWVNQKKTWVAFWREAKGCQLLCANCHGEITYGDTLPNWREMKVDT